MLSFLYPLMWPILNLFTMASASAKPVKNVTTGTFSIAEHLEPIL